MIKYSFYYNNEKSFTWYDYLLPKMGGTNLFIMICVITLDVKSVPTAAM